MAFGSLRERKARLLALFGSQRGTPRHFFRAATLLALATALAACSDAPPVGPHAPTDATLNATAETVRNRYIVLFRNDVADPTALTNTLITAHGGTLGYVYQFALKGFSVFNVPPGAVEALRQNPLVRSVEEAQNLELQDDQYLPLTSYDYRTSALWALDRVDERADVFNGVYHWDHRGDGTHVYIVDSGIRGGHEEWGYARIGASITKLMWSSGASPTIDQHGHGTGVAGAAAGGTYGIAKLATLHSVRVMDGGNTYPCYGPCEEDVIAGIDWVAGYHESPAVMNVSIGGIPGSFGMRDALEGAIASGVIAIKSAGNDAVDAFQDRGNRAYGLIVVGAMDRYDQRASFSNYGSLITLFAPGVEVYTAHNSADNAVATWDGTSFAAPMTAGVAALVLQQEPSADQYRMRDVLIGAATNGELTGDLGAGSPNRLLYSQVVAPPPSLVVTISGPSTIREAGYYNWTASASGGNGSYTYTWEESVDSGPWQVVMVGPTHQKYFENGSGSSWFRVTAVSDGQSGQKIKTVANLIL